MIVLLAGSSLLQFRSEVLAIYRQVDDPPSKPVLIPVTGFSDAAALGDSLGKGLGSVAGRPFFRALGPPRFRCIEIVEAEWRSGGAMAAVAIVPLDLKSNCENGSDRKKAMQRHRAGRWQDSDLPEEPEACAALDGVDG